MCAVAMAVAVGEDAVRPTMATAARRQLGEQSAGGQADQEGTHRLEALEECRDAVVVRNNEIDDGELAEGRSGRRGGHGGGRRGAAAPRMSSGTVTAGGDLTSRKSGEKRIVGARKEAGGPGEEGGAAGQLPSASGGGGH